MCPILIWSQGDLTTEGSGEDQSNKAATLIQAGLQGSLDQKEVEENLNSSTQAGKELILSFKIIEGDLIVLFCDFL